MRWKKEKTQQNRFYKKDQQQAAGIPHLTRSPARCWGAPCVFLVFLAWRSGVRVAFSRMELEGNKDCAREWCSDGRRGEEEEGAAAAVGRRGWGAQRVRTVTAASPASDLIGLTRDGQCITLMPCHGMLMLAIAFAALSSVTS